MRVFTEGARVRVDRYSESNGYYNGGGFFEIGDTGTVVRGNEDGRDSVEVQFDNARVMDGEWYVLASDLSLAQSSSLSTTVITPGAAAIMLRDDIKLFPTDKLEVAHALARIFLNVNPEFDTRGFLTAADL